MVEVLELEAYDNNDCLMHLLDSGIELKGSLRLTSSYFEFLPRCKVIASVEKPLLLAPDWIRIKYQDFIAFGESNDH